MERRERPQPVVIATTGCLRWHTLTIELKNVCVGTVECVSVNVYYKGCLVVL